MTFGAETKKVLEHVIEVETWSQCLDGDRGFGSFGIMFMSNAARQRDCGSRIGDMFLAIEKVGQLAGYDLEFLVLRMDMRWNARPPAANRIFDRTYSPPVMADVSRISITSPVGKTIGLLIVGITIRHKIDILFLARDWQSSCAR